jgi:hypothetical protein
VATSPASASRFGNVDIPQEAFIAALKVDMRDFTASCDRTKLPATTIA